MEEGIVIYIYANAQRKAEPAVDARSLFGQTAGA